MRALRIACCKPGQHFTHRSFWYFHVVDSKYHFCQHTRGSVENENICEVCLVEWAMVACENVPRLGSGCLSQSGAS